MNKNEQMPQKKFGELVAWLAARGMTRQQVHAAIGAGPQGRNNAIVALHLKIWARNLKKN